MVECKHQLYRFFVVSLILVILFFFLSLINNSFYFVLAQNNKSDENSSKIEKESSNETTSPKSEISSQVSPSTTPLLPANAAQSQELKNEKELTREQTAKDQNKIGKLYEDSDQLKEAEAAYKEGLKSQSAETRKDALDGLDRVIKKKKEDASRNDYLWKPLKTGVLDIIWNPLKTFLTTAIPFILTFGTLGLLFWWAWKWADKKGIEKGKNKLGIEQFADATERKIGGNFEKAFEAMLGKMHNHYRPRNLIRGNATLPIFVRSQETKLTEIAEAVIPQGWGKVFSWIMNKTLKSEFLIQGSVQEDGTSFGVLVILSRNGRILQSWSKQIPIGGATSSVDSQKDLAFEVLSYLKEELEYEHEC